LIKFVGAAGIKQENWHHFNLLVYA